MGRLGPGKRGQWEREGEGEQRVSIFPFPFLFQNRFLLYIKSSSNIISNILSIQIKMRNFGKFSKNKFYNFYNSFIFKFSFLLFRS